jgi:hypothetical protein
MHIVHGKIRKEPTVKQLAESVMFIVELAEVTKDHKTGDKLYTNYKAMLFAKTQAATDFYTQATAIGSYVVISSEKLKVEQFKADSGINYVTLMLDNARLEGAGINEAVAPNAQPQRPQQNAPAPQSWGNAPQTAQQAAPQMAPAYQQTTQQQPPKPQYQQQQAATQQQAPAQYNEPQEEWDDQKIPF